MLLHHHPQAAQQQDGQIQQTLQSDDCISRSLLPLLAALPYVCSSGAEPPKHWPQCFDSWIESRHFNGCSKQLPQSSVVRFHGQWLQAEVQELCAVKNGKRFGRGRSHYQPLLVQVQLYGRQSIHAHLDINQNNVCNHVYYILNSKVNYVSFSCRYFREMLLKLFNGN